MDFKLRRVVLLLFIGALLFVGCDRIPTPTPEATEEVPIVVDAFAVVAEGALVPRESVQIAFSSGGQVEEVLVEEGDQVKAGDVLARLGNREPLEAAIAGAELELLSARQALEALTENLDDIQTETLQALRNARQAVDDAEERLDNLKSRASQTDIEAAKATVILAEDALDKAIEDFEPYEDKPETNLARANLRSRLAAAQDAYDDAVRRLNGMLSPGNEFDVSQGEADLEIAKARLKLAEEDYELYQDGVDPDDIEAAESRIAAAEASLAASRAALDDLDLVATIDGKVVDLDLIEGQQATPGQPVVLLVDFSQWFVETDNLTEIEVVDVAIGQKVTVVPDSLPDVELTGVVESIADEFEEKRGDITYTARILMDDIDPRLRWGMTVVVTFEE